MGKRPFTDVVTESAASTQPGTLSRKKSRKDHGENTSKSVATNPVHSKVNGSTTQIPDSSHSEPNNTDITIDDEKLSKAERKAVKKARREAKEAKKAQKLQQESVNELHTPVKSTAEANAVDKAAKKAARKAEKKRLKDAAKAGSVERDSTNDSSKITSRVTSTMTSRAESSATSPEPILNATGYTEHAGLSALPQTDIDAFLSSNFVSIDDPSPSARKLRPIIQFSYLPHTDEAQRVPFANFTAPTPIQAATWPPLLSGRDMVGVAETGSGKTLAFGLPCIRFISSLSAQEKRGVKSVIVSPTRELAQQIYDQLVKLATPANLRAVCVYGGVPKEPQAKDIRKAHIVVATPGRLNDLIGDGSADLSRAEYVVLDEADRMLDKGFEKDIRNIIQHTATKRQTLMFTATWPPSVRELASTFMQSPVKVTIGDNPDGELRANARITQLVEVLESRDKEFRLLQLLKKYQSGKSKDDRILVFCLYKKEATRIENFIRAKGFRVAGIHGDLSQEKRTASLQSFKEGHVPILVATDVAARGLDIPAVKVVINVTFPLTAEDYVHRIGRTGRAGKEGLAITMFTVTDKPLAGALINVLKAANQQVPEELMKFGTTVKKKADENYGVWAKNVDMSKKATKITFD